MKDDAHIGGSITEVGGITVTFDSSVKDWQSKGKGDDATTTDGVDFTGYCAQSEAENGAPINIQTTQAGTLTIFFGRSITKAVSMKEGENGMTGTVLSTGAEVADNIAPNPAIDAWDGIVYELEANNISSRLQALSGALLVSAIFQKPPVFRKLWVKSRLIIPSTTCRDAR